MLGSQRATRCREATALAFGLCVVWLTRDLRASEPNCDLAVTVEGVPQAAVLQQKLTSIARSEGACSSQSWALRVAPGPKGTYVVALWNGSELETRFASQLEVEAVASVLLRVALDRESQSGTHAPKPDVVSPPVSEPPPTVPTADAPPVARPDASSAPPASAAQRVTSSVALEIGPHVSRAGSGGEAGVLGFIHGRYLGAGIFGRVGAQGRTAQSREALEAGLLGALGAPFGTRVWLGGVVEVGGSLQRALGEVGGSTARVSASGVTAGGGVIALYTPWPRLQVGARLMARWSSPTAEPRMLTSTSEKTPGNGRGQGGGMTKSVTTMTVDPASQRAVDALGGGCGSLALSVGYSF